MKTKIIILAAALTLGLGTWNFGLGTLFAQNIGINTTGATPNASALLDIDASPGNNKGLLIPRLTTAQMNAILTPATGLIIYNTDCNSINYYNGTTWIALGNTGSVSTPGAITGSTTPCQNATGIAYSIAAVTGATGYNWTVPTGATVATGQGTTAITVNFATTNGNVCVTAYNACGSSNASCAAITLSTVPAQPSAITGTTPVCQSQSGVAYSVTNVVGVTYAWTYSGTGFTCATGCATNSITANFSASATSGTLSVTPSNACGTGTAQTFAITVNTPPTTAAAGPDQNLCNVTTATLAGNTPSTGTGAWSVVSGTATITTPSSPTSGVTGLTIGASATLRWTISNSPCTPSTDDVIINVSALPTTAAAGPDQAICATTATLAGNTPTVGTGLWTLISGAGTITTPTSPTSGLTALGVGASTFRWTISNSPCTPSTDDVIITRSDVPTTAAAGPDQNLCNVTTTTLAGNTPTVGTGAWSVISGTATITTPSSPTSGVTGLTIGASATLRWTISNSPCTPSTDDVIITVASGSTSSGLVGCWKFSGGATDGSGNGNNGTVNGATLTTDRFGNASSAYTFNGSTAWINCGTGASLNLTGSLTICAWVKTSAAHSNAGIAGRWNANGGSGQEQYVLRGAATNNGYFDVKPSGGQIDPFCATINDNAWHFIVGTWDGTSAKIYKDGTLIQTLSSSGAIGSFSEPFEIGRYAQGQAGAPNYFNGIIDDIRVYNRALTNCDITRLFNEPNGSTCAY